MTRSKIKSGVALIVLLALLSGVGLVYALTIQRSLPGSLILGRVQTTEETVLLFRSLGPPPVALTEVSFGRLDIDAFGGLQTPVRIPVFVQNSGGTAFQLTVAATSVQVTPPGTGAVPTASPGAVQILFGPVGGVLKPAPEHVVVVQPGTGNRVAGELGLRLLRPPSQLGGTDTRISFDVVFKAEGLTTGAGVIVEDFESTTWPSGNWILQAGESGGSSTSTAAAFMGTRGFIGNYGWYRNTATNYGAPGDVIAIWTRFAGSFGGRFYLGFGATSGGAKSLVFSPNTNDIRFQRNTSYGYQELAVTPFSPVMGTWYKLELHFVNANDVIGRLFDHTGSTLLATVSQTYTEGVGGGNLAIRGFDVQADHLIASRPSSGTASASAGPEQQGGQLGGQESRPVPTPLVDPYNRPNR